MKKHEPVTLEKIRLLMKDINFCHDGSIKKISFIKERGVDKKGDLICLSEEFLNTDIEIELILNSYEGAKKNQIVLLQFRNVKIFNFHQEISFDYSDIYELMVESDKAPFNFVFYSTIKKIRSLTISCNQIVCIEK